MVAGNSFCGNSSLWDSSLSWNTTTPELTNCFESTVLVFVPCLVYWLWAIYEVRQACRSRNRPNKLTWLHVVKQILNMIMLVITAVKLVSLLVIYENEDSSHVELSNLIGAAIETLTYVLVLFLSAFAKQRGILVSNALPMFWLLQCIAYAALTYKEFTQTLIDQSVWEKINNVIIVASTVISPLLLVFTSFCETPSTFQVLDNEDEIQDNCPCKRNSLFAILTFSWATKIVILGTRRLLEIDHVDPLCRDMRSATVTRVYDAYFQPSARAIQERDSTPEVIIQKPIKIPLIRALWYVSWWPFFLGGIFECISVGLSFGPPYLLSKMLNFVASDEQYWHGFLYAFGFWILIISQSVVDSLAQYFPLVASVQVKNALISAVYRKILLLSNSAKKNYSAGEITNLMSVDTEEIFEFQSYVYQFLSIPLRIALTLWYLWYYLGPSSMASLGVFAFLSPLSYLLGSKVDYYQEQMMAWKDKRLKQMSEILNGIKVLKLYAWEKPFMKKVLETRDEELKFLKKGAYLDSFFVFLWIAAPFVVCLACFSSFLLSDSSHELTAEIAFVSLSLIGLLRAPMGMLPDLLTRMIKCFVSLKRLRTFLLCEELNCKSVGDSVDMGDAINIKNATLRWDVKGEPVLKDITLNVKKGSLVAIVGPVGSGKSSILSAILGEVPLTSGTINKVGSIAYVPQQAWILNCTLKQNILFRKLYNQRRYNRVLDNCALRSDLEILTGGDMTEIGEKGINLSGGQKQRVSLARAVYQDEEVYLLDDPLSAVDANVAAQLFKEVIGPSGILQRKTRILATHNIAFLSEVDEIIVLANGEIVEQGTYDTLMKDRGKFADFIKEHLNQEHKEDVEDVKDEKDVGKLLVPNGSLVARQISVKRQVSVLSNESQLEEETSCVTGHLTEDESMEMGKVKWEVYGCYIKHIGVAVFVVIFVFNMFSAIFETGSGLWLSHWSTNTTGLPNQMDGLGVYGGIIFCLALTIFFCYIILFYGAVKAARNLHYDLLDCVIKCPLSFFDTTPSGRILNRFSKDVQSVDEQLPWSVGNILNMICWLPTTFIMIALASVYIIPFMLTTIFVYYFVLKIYILTNNQLRRFDSVTRSPVYSNFTETIQGTSSIRAYDAQQYFINRSHQKVDENMKCYYTRLLVGRWLDVALSILSSITILATSLITVFERDTVHVGVLGLALTYCIEMSNGLGWLVKVGAFLESQIVGVERIREYSMLKPEAEWEIGETKPKVTWPDQGSVEIKNYSAAYREGLEPVLKDINLKIEGGTKVGIVGRTGAGKSSLILSLFRIIEPLNGGIMIDGVDIHKIGTHDLRSKLTIIPQDPVLFAGSLRMNLDPWDEHTDEEIWTSLERAHLKTHISTLEGGLDYIVTEGGDNLSGGQRQLVCLARALLRQTKILILDEATASVDLDTDSLIQATVREAFASCTVIIIAHRLHTIIKCDKVICFSRGQLVEEGSPDDLLQKPETHFYSMAKDAGLV